MSLPKIKIDVNAVGFGTITIDGQLLLGVRAINVRVGAGKRTAVTLELIGDVEIEAEPSVINAELLGIPLKIVSGTPRKP